MDLKIQKICEMINFKVFTIFVEAFPGVLGLSVTGNALKNGLWNLEAINIRDYADNLHKTVDDVPFGGGAGMVLKPDVLSKAIEKNISKKTKLVYLSPRGKLFNQKMAQEFSKFEEIGIICGRYEGVDQRVLDKYEIEEISIGDYVLSGGEISSYVFIDAILRNVDGVLGEKDSLKDESFCMEESEFLLEYPHYTRPRDFEGLEVPEVLTLGHHKKIIEWRKKKSIEVTKEKRHDLYEKYLNSKKNDNE